MPMKKFFKLLLTTVCMLMMIFHGAQVSDGAKDGIELCLRTVIPSLFPFFVISSYINGQLSGLSIPFLNPVEKLCCMPGGSGSILLLGLLGGYPVGAQCIAQQRELGTLSKADAQRLLGFCNNTGPAFLFGILSSFFPSTQYIFLLWLVQILSAILTGMLLPGKAETSCSLETNSSFTAAKAIDRATKSIISVCAWVIVFRILLAPFSHVPLLGGIIELTNGCLQLGNIHSLPLRFVTASVYLSFGGLCVHMQTLSAIKDLSLKYYFCGKLLQTAISLILSAVVVIVLQFV